MEKDYWIIHCLWGLQQLGFKFHMKGGTSLSKGWNLLERFSEDIDILIFPPKGEELPIKSHHKKAAHVKCYCPEYTFVEKLQTISTKYRQEQESGELKENQLRHYYDADCLLKERRVQNFIGTEDYYKHKKNRFKLGDEKDLTKNEAFILSDERTLKNYEKGFRSIENLFYGNAKPIMRDILNNLKPWLPKL